MTMNILFVNNFRGRGGGEEFLRELLPGLARRGIGVGLVCRPGTPLTEMFRGSALSVYPTDRSGINALTSPGRIARIIREGRYDIVNIQRGHDILQSWAASLLARRRTILLYTPQVPEFLRSRLLLRRMDGIVTISRHIRDTIAAFDGSLRTRTSIIYYGIDLGKFRPDSVPRGALRTRLGIPSDAPLIGTVGDLWKNQIEFLDALALIRTEFPGTRFCLVASESGIGQVQAFKQKADRSGLRDAVHWAGRLSKDEMLSFYADIDIAVSTHRNEGFGIWLLEAMAMGRPVVAFNEGGVRDSLEHSPAGVLVNGGAHEMAETIISLLRDNARRRHMEAAGPGWTRERFGTERMVDDYVAYFQSLCRAQEE